MSYNPLKAQDSLSELISLSNDSVMIFDKLLKCSSNDELTQDFLNWFQKLLDISKPNAIKLIRSHYEHFSAKEKEFIQLKLDLSKKNIEDYKDDPIP